ncbi:MAG: aspartate dehydrogenase, partial [Candidatus Aerophobetes bacterium]|nr:aspartate dehydrogenase [Candidatus Aerophobetes bacterium]
KLKHSLRIKPESINLEGVIKAADLVIEAVSPQIAGELARKVIENGKNIMIISVGGVVDYLYLFDEARKKGCRIYFPSGAIAGLDGVKAAREAHINLVTLTTSKPPSGLQGAPYIIEKGIDLKSIKKRTVIFEGTCKEAVKAFPRNINVAATLSFAGIGIDKTRVRVIADPSLERNVHHILVEGDFGRLKIWVENMPSPFNPKTSYLAALSAIATLREIADTVQVGT